MSNNNSSSSVQGLSFLSALGIVFIVLKLCHVINWSWIWVLCPFWLGLACVAVILFLIFIIEVITS